jgi:hypothetical protein
VAENAPVRLSLFAPENKAVSTSWTNGVMELFSDTRTVQGFVSRAVYDKIACVLDVLATLATSR